MVKRDMTDRRIVQCLFEESGSLKACVPCARRAIHDPKPPVGTKWSLNKTKQIVRKERTGLRKGEQTMVVENKRRVEYKLDNNVRLNTRVT